MVQLQGVFFLILSMLCLYSDFEMQTSKVRGNILGGDNNNVVTFW